VRSLEWTQRAENLVVAGPSGTGKSHLLEAIGHEAVEQGLTVAWFSVEDLGAIVRRHRVDDTVSKTFAALGAVTLTVVDDIGLLPISQDAAEGLYRLVDASYERRSLALSSNLHPSGFDQLMDKTIASALVDRLMHHAHVIMTDGESVRLADALSGKGVVPFTD
jgi:DNA replication protein DnaC